MSRARFSVGLKTAFLAAFSLISACSHAPTAQHRVERVLYLVFDQMRPDYIDRYDLKHFKEFRKRSKNYDQAYLGYIGAETVVSHLVMSTGRPPRELPWQDDVFFDKAGKLGTPGVFYSTVGLKNEQLIDLMKTTLPEDGFLAWNLKAIRGGSVYAVGEKNYAALTFGSPTADSIITLKKENGRCAPDGLHVPETLQANDRFNLDCHKAYGTEKTFYPLDGSRFVPGDDPAHIGGDIWVADVASWLMDRDPHWSGIFLTFGAIDKVSHMLGEEDGKRPAQTRDVKTPYDLKAILKIADAQLGRMIDELKRRGLLDHTLIVITADHGGQTDKRYLGNGKTAKWGVLKNETAEQEPKWVRHIGETGDVQFTFEDTAIRAWLKPGAKSDRTVRAMKDIPGITEIYALKKRAVAAASPEKDPTERWEYERVFSRLDHEPKHFQDWANVHSLEILNAMANPAAPDLVGFLEDGTGFDLVGDHGGAQERVQRIPLMEWMPGEKASTISDPFPLYRVKDQILHSLAD